MLSVFIQDQIWSFLASGVIRTTSFLADSEQISVFRALLLIADRPEL
jgi:hypothetical protein